MVRLICVLACSACLAMLPSFNSTASAQSKLGAKKGEPVTGTVVSIEKEKTGKNYRMKMKNSDDEEIDVPLIPRTQLAVVAKGDEGFLKQNVYIQTKVAAGGSGMDYFAKDFTVYLGHVTPGPYVKPDPMDKDVFDIGGKILMTDSMGMMVQCGVEPRKISFENEKNVTVRIADAQFIKEGDEVEVEGTMIKAKKQINARVVTVKSAADISSADYFAAIEDAKKSKTSKTKTTPAAKSKTDGDAAAEDAKSSDDKDPFGLLKKKTKGKDTKADKASTTDSKKSDAKKEDAKDSDEKKDEEKDSN